MDWLAIQESPDSMASFHVRWSLSYYLKAFCLFPFLNIVQGKENENERILINWK